MIATVFWVLFLWSGSSQSMMKLDTESECNHAWIRLYEVAKNNSTFGIPFNDFHCVKIDTEDSFHE